MENDNQGALSTPENKATEAVQNSPDTKEQEVQSNTPQNNVEQAAPSFDAQQTYEALKGQYETLGKSYSELRKEFTRRSQTESEMRKKLDMMFDTLSKATETPINPDAFMRELQTQGPKALETYFQKWAEPIKSGYMTELQKRDAADLQSRTDYEIRLRRLDKERYPDFEKLEPLMNELAESDNSPINWNRPINECLDTLYTLVRERYSEKAVQEAVKLGAKSAEERLAKESRSTVAGSGKSVGNVPPDLNKITDINKLREVVASMVGVADRD